MRSLSLSRRRPQFACLRRHLWFVRSHREPIYGVAVPTWAHRSWRSCAVAPQQRAAPKGQDATRSRNGESPCLEHRTTYLVSIIKSSRMDLPAPIVSVGSTPYLLYFSLTVQVRRIRVASPCEAQGMPFLRSVSFFYGMFFETLLEKVFLQFCLWSWVQKPTVLCVSFSDSTMLLYHPSRELVSLITASSLGCGSHPTEGR